MWQQLVREMRCNIRELRQLTRATEQRLVEVRSHCLILALLRSLHLVRLILRAVNVMNILLLQRGMAGSFRLTVPQ